MLPLFSDNRHHFSIRPLLVAVAVIGLLVLTACPLEFEDLEDTPTIIDVTIIPSTISQSDIGTGMTFDAEISTDNFEGELDAESAEVFIGDGEQPAYPANEYIDQTQPNVVHLEGIDSTWFNDHDQPGDYNIGARVSSIDGTESARAINLDIVTVQQ